MIVSRETETARRDRLDIVHESRRQRWQRLADAEESARNRAASRSLPENNPESFKRAAALLDQLKGLSR